MNGANIKLQLIESKTEVEDDQLPPYKEPGQILFHYLPVPNELPEVEVFMAVGSAFWLQEGGFIDDWIQENVFLELEGYYVLEGVRGRAWRDYFGEYDEEWTFEYCRRATQDEALYKHTVT